MPMKPISIKANFQLDTTAARQQLQQLYGQLNQLTNSNQFSTNMTKEITEATRAAQLLKETLKSSVDVSTGAFDLTKFITQIEKGQTSLAEFKNSLTSLGPAGDKAFNSLATTIASAQVPLKRTNSELSRFTTAIANAARWQVSSMAIHKIVGTISEAYKYAQNLDKSLNSIQIVTGHNTQYMRDFAKQANIAAKALSASTLEYTNASLIYYQQGLSDTEVQKRTETTLKLAKVTGESASKVSQQMTSVWNNFSNGVDNLERYADVMAALGATTASSSSEIAKGLEKFSSVTKTIGLSYDYAASALATVVAQTRQSADSVGTGFKTLFSRLESLSLGETLDDGVSLNKYSKALATVGVNVLDATGKLRDMDSILDDLGQKWENLTNAQQVALAQTVGGVRNYTQLITLMDNWEDFQNNLVTSQMAEGTLQKQADIYAKSWEAAQQRVTTAAQGIYDTLISSDFFKGINNLVAGTLNQISSIGNTLGTGGSLAGIGMLANFLYGDKIASGIDNFTNNLFANTKGTQTQIAEMKLNAFREVAGDVGIRNDIVGQARASLLPEVEKGWQQYQEAVNKGMFSGQTGLQQAYFNQLSSATSRATEVMNSAIDVRQARGQYQIGRIQNEGQLISAGVDTTRAKILSEGLQGVGAMRARADYFGRIVMKAQTTSAELVEKELQNFQAVLTKQGIKPNSQTMQRVTNAIENIRNGNIDAAIEDYRAMNAAANSGIYSNTNLESRFTGLNMTDEERTAYISRGIQSSRDITTQELEQAMRERSAVEGMRNAGGMPQNAPRQYSGLKGSFQNLRDNGIGFLRVQEAYNTTTGRYTIQQQNSDGTWSTIDTTKDYTDEQYRNLEARIRNGEETNLRIASAQMTFGEAAVQTGQLVNSFAMAVSSVKGFTTALKEGNASIEQGLMAAGTSLMAFGQVGSLIGNNKELIGKVFSSTSLLGSIYNKGGGTLAQSLGLIGASGSVSLLGAALPVAALATVGAIGYNVYKEHKLNTVESRLDRTSEDKIALNSYAKEKGTQSENVIDVATTQQKNYAKIAEYDPGSREYMSALIANNNAALEFIETYGLQAGRDYAVDSRGAYNFSNEQITNIYERALDQANNATALAQLTADRALQLTAYDVHTKQSVQGNEWDTNYRAAINSIYTELTGNYGPAGQLLSFEELAKLGLYNIETQEYADVDDISTSFWSNISKEFLLSKGLSEENVNLFWQGGIEETIESAVSSLTSFQKDIDAAKASFETSVTTVIGLDKTLSEEDKIIGTMISRNDKIRENYEEFINKITEDDYGIMKNGKYLEINQLREIWRENQNIYGDYEDLDLNITDKEQLGAIMLAKQQENWIKEQIQSYNLNEEERSLISESTRYNSLDSKALADLVMKLNATSTKENDLSFLVDKIINQNFKSINNLMSVLSSNSLFERMGQNDIKELIAAGNALSIEQRDVLTSWTSTYQTTFGENTGKWVYEALVNSDNGLNQQVLNILDEINAENSLTGLASIQRQEELYALGNTQLNSQVADLRKAIITDINERGSLAKELFKASDFQSALTSMQDILLSSGNLTAENIAKLASKNDTLASYLSLTGNSYAAIADMVEAISSGTISTGQLTEGYVTATREASNSEDLQQQGLDTLANQNLPDSYTNMVDYYRNIGKAWYAAKAGNMVMDAPAIQGIASMLSGDDLVKFLSIVSEGGTTAEITKRIETEMKPLADLLTTLGGTGKYAGKGGGSLNDVFAFYSKQGYIPEGFQVDEETGSVEWTKDLRSNMIKAFNSNDPAYAELKEILSQGPGLNGTILTSEAIEAYYKGSLRTSGKGFTEQQIETLSAQWMGYLAATTQRLDLQNNDLLRATENWIEKIDSAGFFDTDTMKAFYEANRTTFEVMKTVDPEKYKEYFGEREASLEQFIKYITDQTGAQSFSVREFGDINNVADFKTALEENLGGNAKLNDFLKALGGVAQSFENGSQQLFDYNTINDILTNTLGYSRDLINQILSDAGYFKNGESEYGISYKVGSSIFGTEKYLSSKQFENWGDFNAEIQKQSQLDNLNNMFAEGIFQAALAEGMGKIGTTVNGKEYTMEDLYRDAMQKYTDAVGAIYTTNTQSETTDKENEPTKGTTKKSSPYVTKDQERETIQLGYSEERQRELDAIANDSYLDYISVRNDRIDAQKIYNKSFSAAQMLDAKKLIESNRTIAKQRLTEDLEDEINNLNYEDLAEEAAKALEISTQSNNSANVAMNEYLAKLGISQQNHQELTRRNQAIADQKNLLFEVIADADRFVQELTEQQGLTFDEYFTDIKTQYEESKGTEDEWKKLYDIQQEKLATAADYEKQAAEIRSGELYTLQHNGLSEPSWIQTMYASNIEAWQQELNSANITDERKSELKDLIAWANEQIELSRTPDQEKNDAKIAVLEAKAKDAEDKAAALRNEAAEMDSTYAGEEFGTLEKAQLFARYDTQQIESILEVLQPYAEAIQGNTGQLTELTRARTQFVTEVLNPSELATTIAQQQALDTAQAASLDEGRATYLNELAQSVLTQINGMRKVFGDSLEQLIDGDDNVKEAVEWLTQVTDADLTNLSEEALQELSDNLTSAFGDLTGLTDEEASRLATYIAAKNEADAYREGAEDGGEGNGEEDSSGTGTSQGNSGRTGVRNANNLIRSRNYSGAAAALNEAVGGTMSEGDQWHWQRMMEMNPGKSVESLIQMIESNPYAEQWQKDLVAQVKKANQNLVDISGNTKATADNTYTKAEMEQKAKEEQMTKVEGEDAYTDEQGNKYEWDEKTQSYQKAGSDIPAQGPSKDEKNKAIYHGNGIWEKDGKYYSDNGDGTASEIPEPEFKASGQNNARILSYASGKNTPYIAMTGELGPELHIKENGETELLGKKGREYAFVNSNDRIYTADQTRKILSNTHTSDLDMLSTGINNILPGYEAGTEGSKDQIGPSKGNGGSSNSGSSGNKNEKDPRYDNSLKLRDVLERYYTILQQLDNIIKKLERIGKVMERSWGEERIRAIQKQTELLQKQFEAQKKYVDEIQTYLTTDKDAMTLSIQEFIDEWNEKAEKNKNLEAIRIPGGAQFDENGVLINYREVVEKMVETFNTAQEKHMLKAEDQKKFEERLKDIQFYTETLNLYEEQSAALEDIKNSILDSMIKEISYRVEYNIEINNDFLKVLNFDYSLVRDNIFRVAEAIDNMGQQSELSAQKIKTYQEAITDLLNIYSPGKLARHSTDELGLEIGQNGDIIGGNDSDAYLNKWIDELKNIKDKKGIAAKIEAEIERDEDTGKITNNNDILRSLIVNGSTIIGEETMDDHIEEWLNQLEKTKRVAAMKIRNLIKRNKDNEDFGNQDIIDALVEAFSKIDDAPDILGEIDNWVKEAQQQSNYNDTINKWVDEIALFNAEAAQKIRDSFEYNESGDIVNYQDIVDQLNQASMHLAEEAQELLVNDPAAFYNMILENIANTDLNDIDASIIEQLNGYVDQIQTEILQNQLGAYQNQIEAIGNMMKNFGKRLDSEMDNFDYYEQIYQSFRDIVNLTNREITGVNANFFKSMNNASMDNAINKVKAANVQYKMFAEQLASVQQAYNDLEREYNRRLEDGNITESQTRMYEMELESMRQQLEQANQLFQDSQNQFLENWEDALSKATQTYEDALKEAGKEFEKSFSPLFDTLELLQAQFDREKELGDLYVDDYQRIHDLSKLNRDIEKSITDTDSLKGKSRLRDLQAEIAQLQEDGVELSEYDLDILDKKYKLELARQALEDARDAKSVVRLSRDNNGNWSYVYTADEDEVAEAEQEYEDAIREMEEANENYIENLQDQMLAVQQKAQQQIQALNPSDFATMDDYLRAVQNILDTFNPTIEYLAQQMGNAIDNNNYLLDPANIAERYGVAAHNLTDSFSDTLLAKLLDEDDLAKVTDAAKDRLDAFAESAKQAFVEYSQWQEQVYEAAEQQMATVGDDFLDLTAVIISSSDQQVDTIQDLSVAMETSFVDAMDSMSKATQNFFDQILELSATTEHFIEQLLQVKYLSGESVLPYQMNLWSKPDTEQELNDIRAALREYGVIDLIDEVGNATRLIAGTKATQEFMDQIRDNILQAKAIDVDKLVDMKEELEEIKEAFEELVDGEYIYVKVGDELVKLIKGTEEAEAQLKEWEDELKKGLPGCDGHWNDRMLCKFNDPSAHHGVGAGYCAFDVTTGQVVTGDTGMYTGRWQSADTGMYTGEWANGSVRRNGRLALLHQRELVLNAHDTENFLDAMKIVRQLDNLANWMANGLGEVISPRIEAPQGTLEQDVTIHAEFPNAKDHNEIEMAFDNLVNLASQYANRK